GGATPPATKRAVERGERISATSHWLAVAPLLAGWRREKGMAKRPRIAVVGSANVDLVTFTDQFPRPGETLFGKQFDLGFGGKGANQAVAASLCGARAEMVARVGDDLFGPATLKNFQSLGVNSEHVRISEGVSSGVAPIFVDDSGENRILVVKGANDLLLPEDVDRAAPVLRKAGCIVLQFEIPLATIYHTIRFAESNGIPCILNPAPAQAADLGEIARVDYFIPNETEAEALTGLSVHSIEEAKKCAGCLLSQGIRWVIITLGAKGALLANHEGMERIPSFKVEVKDTTGAGDAFIGSFATFLCEGLPERQAVERACLYAALSTTRVGTQKSFLTRSDFDEQWAKFDRSREAVNSHF
ncbi:MAG: ribokinase, partial [Acidobacteriota bacterium]